VFGVRGNKNRHALGDLQLHTIGRHGAITRQTEIELCGPMTMGIQLPVRRRRESLPPMACNQRRSRFSTSSCLTEHRPVLRRVLARRRWQKAVRQPPHSGARQRAGFRLRPLNSCT
jgi:hypothetical protein